MQSVQSLPILDNLGKGKELNSIFIEKQERTLKKLLNKFQKDMEKQKSKQKDFDTDVMVEEALASAPMGSLPMVNNNNNLQIKPTFIIPSREVSISPDNEIRLPDVGSLHSYRQTPDIV